MDYQKAKDLRSKSFSDLMTDKLTGGQGIGSSLRETLSEKSKARMTGIKEKFDPMNIIKTLTFGSKLGPALYGKMMGRSEEDMKYFVGKKTRGPGQNKTSGQLDSQADSMAVDALGLIYRLMLRTQEEEKIRIEESKGSIEERDSEEELRNQELVKALTGRRKKEKPYRDEKGRFAKRPTEEKPKPEPTKETPKKGGKKEETPKPTGEKPKVEKAPTTKETPKTTEKVPVKEAPTPKTPTAKEVTKPSAPKPSAEKAPTPSAPRAPVTAGKGIAGTVASGAGVIGVITTGLVAAGITNAYAQKAVIANVGKETGFKPRDENLAAYGNTSNERIREVFTSRTQKYSDAELNEIKKDPYKFGEMVYGKDTKIGQSMGNTQEGDGFKYRGRGSIQLTGKNNYKAYSDVVKKDLVGNPELVNQPEIDAAIVAAFVKRGVGNKINDFTDQQTANRAVTQAIGGAKLNLDVGVGAKILSKVDEYSAALDGSVSTGSRLDQSSKENKDLKESLNNDKPKQSTVNNTTVTSENKETKQSSESVDDRPAHLKKKG
jgi:predicted chitinase